MTRHRIACAVLCALAPSLAFAWGDEGHEIVGLIADHYLDPAVRDQVNALLANDTSHLAAGTDIAHEATWADKYRDAGNRHLHYDQTKNWHYADIEIDGSNTLDAACNQHPAVPAGTPASAGPANDCSADKIAQFAAELHDPATAAAEKLMALQFLLHFVGDEHQPLHSSDDHDQGGNAKKVKAAGLGAEGKLHSYWDTQFVEQLPGGNDANAVATGLIAQISDAQRATWSSGTASDWAQEAYTLAHDHAYALLPQPANGVYTLPPSYVQDATQVVAQQLQRAGVRLALVLNTALGAQTPPPTCTPAARAAAIPDLRSVAGISIPIAESSAGAISATWQGVATTALAFDPNAPQGLQKTLEATLQQAGWTLVESETGAKSYLSRWHVAVTGCATQNGFLLIAPSDDGSRYLLEIELADF